MLDIKVHADGETGGILQLLGKLDNNTAHDLEKAVAECGKRFKKLTVDCTDLMYVSSAGLRVFKQAFMWSKAAGNELVFIHINKEVMDLLKMTGMTRVLNIEE